MSKQTTAQIKKPQHFCYGLYDFATTDGYYIVLALSILLISGKRVKL